MFEILRTIIANIPVYLPIMIVIGGLWWFTGWFYVSVLGREFHDFVIFSVMVLIIFLSVLIMVNRNTQILFFGNL